MDVLHPLANIGDIGKRRLSSLNPISQRLKGGLSEIFIPRIYLSHKVKSDARIFSEFVLKNVTPPRKAISLLLFTGITDDPLNTLVNYSKNMKELCMYFSATAIKHMVLRALWEKQQKP